MITGEGKAICDKEIGSPARGWHSCRAPAQYKLPSLRVPYMDLHFCERHVPRCNQSMMSRDGTRTNADRCGLPALHKGPHLQAEEGLLDDNSCGRCGGTPSRCTCLKPAANE